MVVAILATLYRGLMAALVAIHEPPQCFFSFFCDSADAVPTRCTCCMVHKKQGATYSTACC